MKKKLTKLYMEIYTFSIFLIVVIWILLSVFFIFGGKDSNENEPQYLVNRFGQYVTEEQEIKISEEGKKVIKENNVWVQIINDSGEVIDSYNVNENIPQKYNIFDCVDYTMHSNSIENQTIFISKITDKNYGVLIGCDSARVSKLNIKITGGLKKGLLMSFLILISVFLVVGAIAGIIFSRSISDPVNEIVENINYLENDGNICITNENNIYISVFESIKNLKERLLRAENTRVQLEQQRKEWIANISHDMKTPLTTIKGYAEIMADEEYEISIEERKNYSAKIERNVNVIENLIKDLNFSRLLKEDKIQMQKTKINICSLLKQCCEDIYIRYNDIVQFEFSTDDIYIEADENYMRRVFVNILCNAFIHNGNDINVLIRCFVKDNVIVEIEDDGKGMSEDELEKIFTRYYRGKASTEIDGSGLGLSIALEIVKAHQGKIAVMSEVGKGTKFTIQLEKCNI